MPGDALRWLVAESVGTALARADDILAASLSNGVTIGEALGAYLALERMDDEGLNPLEALWAQCPGPEDGRTPLAVAILAVAGPDHQFVGVAGHPDDDECTYRADGTDGTYCGRPEAAHGAIRAVAEVPDAG